MTSTGVMILLGGVTVLVMSIFLALHVSYIEGKPCEILSLELPQRITKEDILPKVLLTERAQVKSLPERFEKAHGDKAGKPHYERMKKDIGELDLETASGREVAELMGNTSWVKEMFCDECNEKSFDAVKIGETVICLNCLNEALGMFGENSQAR